MRGRTGVSCVRARRDSNEYDVIVRHATGSRGRGRRGVLDLAVRRAHSGLVQIGIERVWLRPRERGSEREERQGNFPDHAKANRNAQGVVHRGGAKLMTPDSATCRTMQKMVTESSFRWMMNENAVTTEKLAHCIRAFVQDRAKLGARLKTCLTYRKNHLI